MDLGPDLIGQSPSLVEVREQIARLLTRQAESGRLLPVLIEGETGTGKTMIARLMHRASSRRTGPYVAVSLLDTPETLIEPALFGQERGAFTDAREARDGFFRSAHRGTIFLDEITEISPAVQAKLLKVIEERAIRRVGSTRLEPVDVWIIAASNRNLTRAVEQHLFRKDLYHRLAVVTLRIPPLRERLEDVIPLAEHFLAQACFDYHLPPHRFTDEARAALVAYDWPGNIRELSSVIERVALNSDSTEVSAATLGLSPRRRHDMASRTRVEPDGDGESGERERLLEALDAEGGNISRAADRLGLSRNTFRYRLGKHGPRGPASGGPGRIEPPPIEKLPPPGAAAPTARDEAPTPEPGAPALPRADGITLPLKVRWERRRLTFLRAEFGGHSPGSLAPSVGHPFEILIDKVQSFGGRIEDLSVGGIVAVFGLDSGEDAPTRAGHAAMAMQRAADRARSGEAGAPPLRVGIHINELSVGQTGNAINIDRDAKRAMDRVLDTLVATQGTEGIWVSNAAAPYLDRRFALSAEGASLGSDRIWRLTGRAGVGASSDRLPAQFVGRRQHLDLLHMQLASAIEGRGQVVGIVGEAGMGKSRLLHEFRASLAGRAVTWIAGDCFSYGTAIPYLPVLEVLRQNFALLETDRPEDIVEKVQAGLDALGMRGSAPYLFHILGITEGTEALSALSPEALRARTLETIRQMSLRASQQRPLVVAIEDLHWIDKTSEEFIATMVEILAGASILFLATYRPGYRPPWIDRSFATQIPLPPLSAEDGLTVVRSVLRAEEVPDATARLILGKAKGNPFFLEELSRVVREQGEFGAVPAVPGTIHDVVLARIERLPDTARRLLETAAVLGSEVSARVLHEVWDDHDDLHAVLRDLTATEFLYEYAAGDGPVYGFKHTFFQEVAYEGLPVGSRQTLHAAAGRALERLYDGRLQEVYDRLAFHYSRAGSAEKAVEYLARSAAWAARGHAHTEAVQALEEALVHVQRLPEPGRHRRRLDLVLRRASSLLPLGRLKESLDLLLREHDGLERVSDPGLASHYYLLLGRTYSFLGDYERAAEHARLAIKEAERSGDRAAMGKAHCLLAEDTPFSGQAPAGIQHGRQAIALLESTTERWWLGQAHFAVGLNHAVIGDFAPALDALARAEEIGKRLEDRRLGAFAGWVIGAVHIAMGRWVAGLEACRRTLDSSPDPLNRAIAAGWLGFAHLESDDPRRAIPELERAIERMRDFRYRHFEGWFTAFLAEAHRAAGDPAKARELAARALQVARDAKLPLGIAWALHVLGRVAADIGDLDEAEGHLVQAQEIFTRIQSQWERGRLTLDLARLAYARGHAAGAAEYLREGRDIFRKLAIPHYVERAEKLAMELNVALDLNVTG